MNIIQKINTNDVKDLHLKFIIQFNLDEPEPDITKSDNFSFWMEKRIRLISINQNQVNLIGFYLGTANFPSTDLFVDFFNSEKNKRYHRLLTVTETLFVIKHWNQNTTRVVN